MEEAVSAADANRKFSPLRRGAQEGRSYIATAQASRLTASHRSTRGTRSPTA